MLGQARIRVHHASTLEMADFLLLATHGTVLVLDPTFLDGSWRDGLVILDVGNGMAGGSPENPKLIAQYKFNHYELYGDGWLDPPAGLRSSATAPPRIENCPDREQGPSALITLTSGRRSVASRRLDLHRRHTA